MDGGQNPAPSLVPVRSIPSGAAYRSRPGVKKGRVATQQSQPLMREFERGTPLISFLKSLTLLQSVRLPGTWRCPTLSCLKFCIEPLTAKAT